jgi:hypothetical protein
MITVLQQTRRAMDLDVESKSSLARRQLVLSPCQTKENLYALSSTDEKNNEKLLLMIHAIGFNSGAAYIFKNQMEANLSHRLHFLPGLSKVN